MEEMDKEKSRRNKTINSGKKAKTQGQNNYSEVANSSW